MVALLYFPRFYFRPCPKLMIGCAEIQWPWKDWLRQGFWNCWQRHRSHHLCSCIRNRQIYIYHSPHCSQPSYKIPQFLHSSIAQRRHQSYNDLRWRGRSRTWVIYSLSRSLRHQGSIIQRLWMDFGKVRRLSHYRTSFYHDHSLGRFESTFLDHWWKEVLGNTVAAYRPG